jgi:molybdopterin synthase sulfur carrier subunit
LATVVLPSALRPHAQGRERVELEARDVRGLLEALERRFPGIRARLEGRMAIAIDGEIVNDPLLESIEPESEVHFLPRIGGGR